MKLFLLEEQPVNGEEASGSEASSSREEYAARQSLEACQCPHLRNFLPHVLNLDCVPSSSKSNSWTVANPVHALHLSSILQPDGATVLLPKGHLAQTMPSLFGDEQRRTDTVLAPGITSSYCPLISSDGEASRYIIKETVPVKKSPKEQEELSGETPAGTAVPNVSESKSSSGTQSLQSAKYAPPATVTSLPPLVSGSLQGSSGAKSPLAPQPNATNRSSANVPTTDTLPLGVPSQPSTRPKTAGPMYPFSLHTVGSSPVSGRDNATLGIESKPAGTNIAVQPSTFTSPSATPSNTIVNQMNVPAKPPQIPAPKLLLPEDRFRELLRMEELILQQQNSVLSKRTPPENSRSKKRKREGSSKSFKLNGDLGTAQCLPSSYLDLLSGAVTAKGHKMVTRIDRERWEHDAKVARSKVEQWMESFRINRNAYWDRKELTGKATKQPRSIISPFGSFEDTTLEEKHCILCSRESVRGNPRAFKVRKAVEDELLQCLDCSFVGCGPSCVVLDSKQHIIQHMLETGHSFAVTCGARSEIYCFKCGDFVYHSVYDAEKKRIDISRRFPWMGWPAHAVQRSFDPLRFVTTSDHDVVWRGCIASYPALVPSQYTTAAQWSIRRQDVFLGKMDTSCVARGAKAMEFSLFQQSRGKDCWKIRAPVGMYNLGNTCFLSSIINVLIHCVPLQRHFLLNVRHHHKSCQHIRQVDNKRDTKTVSAVSNGPASVQKNDASQICLACEMDVLFLQYFGRSTGKDALAAICEPLNPVERFRDSTALPVAHENTTECDDVRGEPLIVSDFLTAAWRSGGMDHMVGYEQRDAHEFLHAFLDIMGKHARRYHECLQRMRESAIATKESDGRSREGMKAGGIDCVKELFEGTLRSVLICEQCGCKRSMTELFLNVSLPLAKHVQGKPADKLNSSVQECLKQFTDPEALTDSVHCPSCKKKTATKKQHTFAKLPKVLCLQLKRFDAAKNKKIGNFVAFPGQGLDMGPLLPHWCEVTQGKVLEQHAATRETEDVTWTSPNILYDLFGTVNHKGTMNQGHYVSNVKVDGQWFHCNDAHVSRASENDVLQSDGAYILFYIRRQ